MGVAEIGMPRRILIVDDSRTIRALLRLTLEEDPRLEVVGEAADPYEARAMIKSLNPDVITLDVEMPRMSGLEFLEHLMRLRPVPVVMVSSRTRERSEDALKALSIGAVECVDIRRVQADAAQRTRLANTLYMASRANVRARVNTRRGPEPEAKQPYKWNGKLVLIGSSTGGVHALERVLAHFPANCPPTVIAQHMPASFLASFATRLNRRVTPDIALAHHLDEIGPGQVRLAPGGTQHLVLDSETYNRLRLEASETSDLHVPSVDRLFASAQVHASTLVAVVLTGMGSDGAMPMAALRKAGAMTLAQRDDTCVVDGMPKAAREAGAVVEEIPIEKMGRAILRETCA